MRVELMSSVFRPRRMVQTQCGENPSRNLGLYACAERCEISLAITYSRERFRLN